MTDHEVDPSHPDRRLIEDYIPIEAISGEARREKSIRKGHISTLHLWWARRPLVAARAALHGALVPAPDKDEAKAAAEFVAELCKCQSGPETINAARRRVLQAHAERLTTEMGRLVTVEDIEAGRAPRPRVLDMFAGGGSIPLEALRLGCEAYALDLNPVAHIIELCTLVYPQQFGTPDPTARGSAPDGTWAGLAKEVEHWGHWVLDRVRADIGDLYPAIPDPTYRPDRAEGGAQLTMDLAVHETRGSYHRRGGMLTPVAYLWTRTVRCKNPACGAAVPLARQTWLVNTLRRHTALRIDVDGCRQEAQERKVAYRVVEAATAEDLGSQPATGSRGGNVACPFCGTVADNAYVKAEGMAGNVGIQPMAVVCTKPRQKKAGQKEAVQTGKVYLEVDQVPTPCWPDDKLALERIQRIEAQTAMDLAGPITPPQEPLPPRGSLGFRVQPYGLVRWADLFTGRQLLSLLSLTHGARSAYATMTSQGYDEEHAKVVTTYLSLLCSRTADWNSTLTHWTPQGEKLGPTFTRMALPMVWDFVEINPLEKVSGSASEALRRMCEAISAVVGVGRVAGRVSRGSAAVLPFENAMFDAIITDPPYYDNLPYSDMADFFYVWLKRSIGFLYPDSFSSLLSPKKQEAIMDPGRHNRDQDAAKRFYEDLMARAFAEAGRTLKPGAPLVIVYAHKTTMGWVTLVNALREAGFTVTEAWPLDTERPGRPRANQSAALSSSIFLVARRRDRDDIGSYERDVQPDLRRIIRERVDRLWSQGVTGADLVIACVGAGLRAFTRYARVEYANGEPVAADSFLAEVEGEVLETLLEKLFGVSRAGVSSVDRVTRFYVLWRYAYRHATLDAGEAIVFAYPQRVELDGPGGLSSGSNPLVEKQKGMYRLRDFTERGRDPDLGLPQGAELAPTIDVLHRLLWLVENRPGEIGKYLDDARPDVERLRVVAQTLAGQTLAGNGSGGGRSLVAARGAEAAELRKLTTNWRTLIEAHRGPVA